MLNCSTLSLTPMGTTQKADIFSISYLSCSLSPRAVFLARKAKLPHCLYCTELDWCSLSVGGSKQRPWNTPQNFETLKRTSFGTQLEQQQEVCTVKATSQIGPVLRVWQHNLRMTCCIKFRIHLCEFGFVSAEDLAWLFTWRAWTAAIRFVKSAWRKPGSSKSRSFANSSDCFLSRRRHIWIQHDLTNY